MKLVIVESPTKAKTIQKFLGKDFQVKSSMGHVVDLPKNSFGIDVKNGFKPYYIVIKGKEKIVSVLKDLSKKVEDLFIATDPDREGEAIGYHIVNLIGKKLDEVKRVVFHEVTYHAIKDAFNNSREINLNLVEAQKVRRLLDRIVGYKLSPLLWKKLKGGLSAGRVQSVALKILVEREREIEKFKPKPFYNLIAKIGIGGNLIETELISYEDKKKDKNGFYDRDKLEGIKDFLIKNPSLKVEKISRRGKKDIPPPPFITSTLQQEAIKRFGFSSERVMSIAQRLYEGVELPQGRSGLITYHRTDSFNISDMAIRKVRDYIKRKFGEDFLPEKKRIYKTKSKLAQEAHEAIRPTDPQLEPDKIKNYLSDDEYKIYSLIFERFLACQMKEALIEEIGVLFVNGNFKFKAIASYYREKGYRILFKEKKEEERKKKYEIFNGIKEEDVFKILKVEIKKGMTKPPQRFTEATLIKKLEEEGIGRPSTYATILGILKKRGYVKKSKGHLYPQAICLLYTSPSPRD